MAHNFEHQANKANHFFNELGQELGTTENRAKTIRIFKAVVHTLRDRLTIGESLDLLAQLPMILKALFVEGWKYHEKPEKFRHLDQFAETVLKEDGNLVANDLQSKDEVINASKKVFKVLSNYISEGEMEDIKSMMPTELKGMFDEILEQKEY